MEQPTIKCVNCHTDIVIPLAAIRIFKNGEPVDMKDVVIRLETECPSCGTRQQVNWLPASGS